MGRFVPPFFVFMKELDKEFIEKGFNHKQIEKIGFYYIYEKTKDKYKGYEVILPLKKKEFECYGRVYEGGDYYPNSALWGQFGWTYTNLDDARKRANLENTRREEFFKKHRK